MTRHSRMLDELFEEIAIIFADIPNDEQLAINIAKDIISKNGLSLKERNYLQDRVSKELGVTITYF